MTKKERLIQLAKEHREKHGTWPNVLKAASAVGLDVRESYRVMSVLKNGLSCETESFKEESETIKRIIEDDKFQLVVESLTISTVDEALAAANVDLDVWQVKQSRVNSWQVSMKIRDTKDGPERIVQRTNYQVRIDLVPRIVKPIDAALNQLVTRLIENPIKSSPRKYKTSLDACMLEIALYDAHFGKLAWAKETRQEDYDTEIAERVYVDACEDIISRATNQNIEKIVFPIGQDFFHINNPEGFTPQGKHQLDMDTRMPKIFEAGLMAVFKAVDMCLQVAPTELIWVPGNHDPETSYFLMRVIKAYYEGRGEKHLSVDISPAHRKAIIYGDSLLAFAHGANEKIAKLPNLMMVEWPGLMAKARFKEWHIGHIHKKDEEKYFPVQTVAGVLIRRIPALSAIDAWHYKFGFIDAVRAAEGFLWQKDRGVVNHITSNLIHR
jgi:hypothetical protein